MKTSKTIEDAFGDMSRLETTGDVRRLIATALMAKLRGELSDATMLSIAKGADSMANVLSSEVKAARAQVELRDKGASFGQVVHLGQMLIDKAPRGGAA